MYRLDGSKVFEGSLALRQLQVLQVREMGQEVVVIPEQSASRDWDDGEFEFPDLCRYGNHGTRQDMFPDGVVAFYVQDFKFRATLDHCAFAFEEFYQVGWCQCVGGGGSHGEAER